LPCERVPGKGALIRKWEGTRVPKKKHGVKTKSKEEWNLERRKWVCPIYRKRQKGASYINHGHPGWG